MKRDWLAERLPLREIEQAIRHKTVPQHRHSVWYYLGGMTLFFFAVQVVTGILLLLYYRPSAAEAYDSVQFIMTRVPFGWLVRSIHSWSANLMVGAAFVHLFSVLFLKAYRKPRELTWVSGVFLLFLTMGFGFTGYLLPWNELAFFATRVGTDIAKGLPVVGEGIVRFLRGGPDVTGATLTRFFGVHMAVLPALVVRTPTGEVKAFNATCSHLACTVQYRTDLEHIWCACHNGHYDLNGKNIAGPPPRPLTEYDAHVQGD